MGRPLYSSVLLSRQTSSSPEHSVGHSEPTSPQAPAVEKWSPWNAFDPDSDEFFQAEDAVYEAFLPEQGVTPLPAREMEGARVDGVRMAEVVTGAAGAANRSERVAEGIEAGLLRTTEASRSLEGYFLDETSDRTFEGESRVVDPSVPGITLDPPISPTPETMQRQLFSPDSPDLVSGLPHLSESPQPMQALDLASRPVSPVPDTPARVSGIFSMTPVPSHAVHSPPLANLQQLHRDAYGYYYYSHNFPHRISRLPGHQPSLYRYPPIPSPLTS